ncbi:nitroreductase family protein [Candidatus Woesearchaeota archaeon]|nr:nitroreductase family protein [Candidatus Woesearchaeota archaeon]
MDVLWAIKNRRSCRSYLQKPVEFDKITAIIEAGHYAPSAGNLQDWNFIIVTEADIRKAISEHCMEQYWMAQAPAMIVVCSNEERTEQRYGLRGKRLYSIQSCAAAMENMLLAAEALGLGTCWVGAFDEEFVTQSLNIPETARPQAIVTLGYKGEEPEPKDLTSLQSLVYFNAYGNRLKKPHLVLKDFSVEWEQQAKKAAPVFKEGLAKIKAGVQQLKEQVKEQQRPDEKEKQEEGTGQGKEEDI